MRNQNNFKTNFVNLKKRLVIIVIILFSQFINAQIDGIVGPTLVISSAKSGTYEISKNNGFEISNEYVMAHVNSAAADTGISLAPNFKYLDQAINYYLDRNYQRIIILEGEYTVNNPIEIDFVNKYIIDKDATEKKIDLGLYPNGFYKVALITDGQIVDVKILSKL